MKDSTLMINDDDRILTVKKSMKMAVCKSMASHGLLAIIIAADFFAFKISAVVAAIACSTLFAKKIARQATIIAGELLVQSFF